MLLLSSLIDAVWHNKVTDAKAASVVWCPLRFLYIIKKEACYLKEKENTSLRKYNLWVSVIKLVLSNIFLNQP